MRLIWIGVLFKNGTPNYGDAFAFLDFRGRGVVYANKQGVLKS
jgi:hypothetical protein